ncbi:hypothetical protein [Cohnella caldifontis]|uniref:hypothetical protein n=1 Tax=Cohnella caldifontis TaxID=3027471 RepID=UPI0023EBAB9F|nr:hypothetical protein [Cohnella sp. YIM B05605]
MNGTAIDVKLKNGVPVALLRSVAQASGAALEWDGRSGTARIVFAGQLNVYGDTVSQLGECVIQNRFVPGDTIVFRMRATNALTGKVAEDAKLQVRLSTGEVLDMQLGNHSPDPQHPEMFWTAAYPVTDQTPKGTLAYSVTARTATAKGEFKPFNVLPSLLTIVSPDQAAGSESAAPTQGE